METNGAIHLKRSDLDLNAAKDHGPIASGGGGGGGGAGQGALVNHIPEWRLLEANDWNKRQLALSRCD